MPLALHHGGGSNTSNPLSLRSLSSKPRRSSRSPVFTERTPGSGGVTLPTAPPSLSRQHDSPCVPHCGSRSIAHRLIRAWGQALDEPAAVARVLAAWRRTRASSRARRAPTPLKRSRQRPGGTTTATQDRVGGASQPPADRASTRSRPPACEPEEVGPPHANDGRAVERASPRDTRVRGSS